MELSVYNILNGSRDAVFHDDGLAMYKEVAPFVKRGEVVEVSFDGIRVCTTQFLNAFIGKLLLDFGPEDVQKYVHPTSYSEVFSFGEKYSLVFSNFEEKNRGAIEEAYA